MGVLFRGGHHGHGLLHFHPEQSALTSSFLSTDAKKSDAHAAHTLEAAAWSPLLSAEERAKLVHGLVSKDCVIFGASGPEHPALVGPAGYLAWQDAWRAAIPDLRSSVVGLGSSDPAVSSFHTVQWTRGGTFAGPADLFGVAPTGGGMTVHGVTCLELKGAQVVKVHVYVEMSRHVAHACVGQVGA